MNDFAHINLLIRQHALKIAQDGEVFTLSSGKESRYYFDLRQLHFNPKYLYRLVNALWTKIICKGWRFDRFGGPSIGADPLVCGLTQFLGKWPVECESFLIRKEAKIHGTGGKIVGNVSKGNRCIIIEDVTTTGESALKAIEAVVEVGATVEAVVSVLDRQEICKRLKEVYERE